MIDDRDARASAPSRHIDALLAWTADGVVCVYFAWMSIYHWDRIGWFAQMFAAMHAEPPVILRFLVEQASWFYPALFATLTLVLVGKELLIRDKRISAIVTFLLGCAGQLAFHALTVLYDRPIGKLVG